jgi:hypothetical protein
VFDEAYVDTADGLSPAGCNRLLKALVHRPWGAAEICRSDGLLQRLVDPRTETSAQEWRYSVVRVTSSPAL